MAEHIDLAAQRIDDRGNVLGLALNTIIGTIVARSPPATVHRGDTMPLRKGGRDLAPPPVLAEHAVDEEGDAIAGAPRQGVQSHQSRVLAVMRRRPNSWEADWISGLPRIW